LDSESDGSDWDALDDEDDDFNTVLYDSPIDQIDEVLNLGAHLQQLQ
jgi:hypothetical protein